MGVRAHEPPIRAWREGRGLTQRELAAKADVDQGQLSRAERGLEGLSVDNIYRVAHALGLTEVARTLKPFTRERR